MDTQDRVGHDVVRREDVLVRRQRDFILHALKYYVPEATPKEAVPSLTAVLSGDG